MKVTNSKNINNFNKIIKYIFILVALLLIINLLDGLFFIKKIKGISMHPTLPNNSYVIGVSSILINYVSTFEKLINHNLSDLNYEINDIVLIEKKYDIGRNEYMSRLFVKRIYLRSGDTLFSKNNEVIISDSLLSVNDIDFILIPRRGESYKNLNKTENHNDILKIKNEESSILESKEDYFTIYDNYYFVLGDNLKFSNDSREWGLVSESTIFGKVLFNFKF